MDPVPAIAKGLQANGMSAVACGRAMVATQQIDQQLAGIGLQLDRERDLSGFAGEVVEEQHGVVAPVIANAVDYLLKRSEF
jgi:hypothetical protein